MEKRALPLAEFGYISRVVIPAIRNPFRASDRLSLPVNVVKPAELPLSDATAAAVST